MHMSSRDSKKRTRSDNGMLLLGAACVIVFIVALQQPSPVGPSSEARFADRSIGGLYIVPASCPSAPPPITETNGSGAAIGYVIPSGISGAEIPIANFCVTNSSGNSYFLPVNTGDQTQSFYNAANAGTVPGVPVYPTPVP